MLRWDGVAKGVVDGGGHGESFGKGLLGRDGDLMNHQKK